MLLRIADVNPDSITTHSDRVLYRPIGAYILLYFRYATAGGAAFVDAGAGYSHPLAACGWATHPWRPAAG